MRFVFSILSLLCVVGFIAWLSMKEVTTALEPTVQSPVPGQTDLVTPIDSATQAKQLIESRNPLIPNDY